MSPAEKAALAAKRTMETGVNKGRSSKKEDTGMAKGNAGDWVYTKEALDILGISSTGALGKLRASGKIEARKDSKGKWLHSVDSLKARNSSKGKGSTSAKGTGKGKRIEPNAQGKATFVQDKGSSASDRVAALEQEVAQLKAQIAGKGRRRPLKALARKVRAFRAA